MFEDFSELGLLLSLCSPSAGKRHQPWQWCFTLYTYSSFILSDKHIKLRNDLCSVLYIKNITWQNKYNFVEYTDCLKRGHLNYADSMKSQNTGVIWAVVQGVEEEENRWTAIQLTGQIIIHVQALVAEQIKWFFTNFHLHVSHVLFILKAYTC